LLLRGALIQIKDSTAPITVGRCPLWVKSGLCVDQPRCPLFTQKRKLKGTHRMSALCQKQTFRLPYWLPTIERFNAQDGREMPRDLLPTLALVETGKDRAAIGPEVHPHRLAFVTPHGLPQNGEVAGFLW
jgi:hypothetical protein